MYIRCIPNQTNIPRTSLYFSVVEMFLHNVFLSVPYLSYPCKKYLLITDYLLQSQVNMILVAAIVATIITVSLLFRYLYIHLYFLVLLPSKFISNKLNYSKRFFFNFENRIENFVKIVNQLKAPQR